MLSYRINAMIKSAFGMYGLLSTSFVGDDNVFSNEYPKDNQQHVERYNLSNVHCYLGLKNT